MDAAKFVELRHHQHFVSSKVMVWVVLDRAAKIAARVGGFNPVQVRRWQTVAAAVKAEVLACGREPRVPAALWRRYAGRVRIDETLGLQGFVYRFEPDRSEGEDPRPLGQFEGAFLPCTFWMIAARAVVAVERAKHEASLARR